jgi:hypothetical protein
MQRGKNAVNVKEIAVKEIAVVGYFEFSFAGSSSQTKKEYPAMEIG